MRTSSILSVLLLTGTLASCGRDAPTAAEQDPLPQLARSAAACQNISGTVDARFLSDAERSALPAYAAGADIAGTLFDRTGTPLGEAYAWIDDLRQAGGGSIHLAMRHRYVIGGSLLDTDDRGVLAPVSSPLYRFNNRLEIVGGTGAYAVATGFISAHGTVVLGGAIELQYHGRLCA
ncbi:MAG TPA: hypothetical protein VMM77_05070 [Gemmatimonadaceae bacterium]|nr:hypothetical protein [Gemmatimonadaceae bacterium]